MFEAYGIRVSSEHEIVPISRLTEFVWVFQFELNKTFFSPQLPLLKALIDRLLQDGIEEVLHVLGTSKKTKENTETHTSNIITKYTVCKHEKVLEFIHSKCMSSLMYLWQMHFNV